jgi:hypothetical protein
MKAAERRRRYDAAHVLDGAMDRRVVLSENSIRLRSRIVGQNHRMIADDVRDPAASTKRNPKGRGGAPVGRFHSRPHAPDAPQTS